MSVRDLGSGLGAFITLAITALFYSSLGGVLSICARFYILSAALMPFPKTLDKLAPQTAMKNKTA